MIGFPRRGPEPSEFSCSETFASGNKALMTWFYRNFIRPALFTLDSERIHDRTLKALAWASQHERLSAWIARHFAAPDLPVELFGLRFSNPIGLAAGMDKRAAAVPIWSALGFGFAELGGVTWHPQPGNPRPRMFRAVGDEALINRMGFNNDGAEAMAKTLEHWQSSGRWPNHPIGINLGKSKVTPLEAAAEDYANSFRSLRPHGDFFVVNVSSPNTPNLRQLQDKAALDEILEAIQKINRDPLAIPPAREMLVPPGQSPVDNVSAESEPPGSAGPTRPKPILVKIAPDLSFHALDELLGVCALRGVAGIIATNTTVTRPSTKERRLERIYSEPGGLSGRPLRHLSTEIIRYIYKQTRGTLPIVGVGGVFNADDALAKIGAGAALVQVYTGLVYEGPCLVKQIVRGLKRGLADHGFKDVRSAVGFAAR